MAGESGVTRNIIDEFSSSDIQRDQIEVEGSVSRRIIDKLHSLDIQPDQMQGESGVTRSIIDELHSSDLIRWKVKMVLFEVSLIDFILWISKEI